MDDICKASPRRLPPAEDEPLALIKKSLLPPIATDIAAADIKTEEEEADPSQVTKVSIRRLQAISRPLTSFGNSRSIHFIINPVFFFTT